MRACDTACTLHLPCHAWDMPGVTCPPMQLSMPATAPFPPHGSSCLPSRLAPHILDLHYPRWRISDGAVIMSGQRLRGINRRCLRGGIISFPCAYIRFLPPPPGVLAFRFDNVAAMTRGCLRRTRVHTPHYTSLLRFFIKLALRPRIGSVSLPRRLVLFIGLPPDPYHHSRATSVLASYAALQPPAVTTFLAVIAISATLAHLYSALRLLVRVILRGLVHSFPAPL